MIRKDLRNIAIIAHVDHGKTTLVDEMLKQGGIFRSNQHVDERVMDSGDLERERGITILAKNTAAYYKDFKINIIDTPGHADFSGEVERVLKMVSGVLLLVDAVEGPMPQTRFVLQKALELGHKIIVCVNKVDRPDAEPKRVVDEVLELMMDLNADDAQLDSPIVYCSGRNGTSSMTVEQKPDLTDLFETIVNYIDPPEGDENAPFQVLVSSIDYNDYVGRIGIGRVERGSLKVGQDAVIASFHGDFAPYKTRIVTLMQIDGLKRVNVDSAKVGDIICFSGSENVTIGDTLCAVDKVEPIPFMKIGEPTLEMRFMVNDSPFAGREGKFVTTRHLRDRLSRELLKDVSLRVEDTENTDTFLVKGRGEMHLSVLIETMRREGYEFAVSMPKVLYQYENGKKLEPVEQVIVDVPETAVGAVMEKLGTSYVSGGTINIETTGDSYPYSLNGASDTKSPKGIKIGWAVKKNEHTFSDFSGDFVVTGGTITVKSTKAEAIEVKRVLDIKGGEVYAYSDVEDAINSASDFIISGGYVCGISLGNDGLDANGNFFIKGGVVFASGKSSPEVAIDANTEGGFRLYVTGGTLFALGGLESGASLSQSCYQASSWSKDKYYSLTVGNDTYVFKTPSSGGSPLVVSGASQPGVKSGVTVSGGTSIFGGNGILGGSVSGGSSVTLSTYTSGNGMGGNPPGGPGGRP